jgi:arginine-tRNA-protein transferase
MPDERYFQVKDTCPYLAGKESTLEISALGLSPERYENLLAEGWRRSGEAFYRYSCTDCLLCIPIRVSDSSIRLSGRLKRVLSRNSDLRMRLLPASDNDEYFNLYEKYTRLRHGSFEQGDRSIFRSLFCYSSSALTEYRTVSGALIALGFVDMLPNGISSVYFAFDPEHQGRSLGYLSVVLEARLAAEFGKKWYYLGFWVPGSAKMDYKADFAPFQIAPRHEGLWVDARDREDACSRLALPRR